MAKYLTLVFVLSILFTGCVFGQKAVIKTNALYWVASTPNLGAELKLGKAFSLDVSGNYNPFRFGHYRYVKHWLVQPELRYWPCKVFKGHFIGLHGHYAEYNVSWKKEGGRYSGNLYGGGFSYGYQWLLSSRWSVEAEVGVGYARLRYDKYTAGFKQGVLLGSGMGKNYVGPTRLGVNFIYVLK